MDANLTSVAAQLLCTEDGSLFVTYSGFRGGQLACPFVFFPYHGM
jgi:hypothetical protein